MESDNDDSSSQVSTTSSMKVVHKTNKSEKNQQHTLHVQSAIAILEGMEKIPDIHVIKGMIRPVLDLLRKSKKGKGKGKRNKSYVKSLLKLNGMDVDEKKGDLQKLKELLEHKKILFTGRKQFFYIMVAIASKSYPLSLGSNVTQATFADNTEQILHIMKNMLIDEFQQKLFHVTSQDKQQKENRVTKEIMESMLSIKPNGKNLSRTVFLQAIRKFVMLSGMKMERLRDNNLVNKSHSGIVVAEREFDQAKNNFMFTRMDMF